jgi:hypothetical protein
MKLDNVHEIKTARDGNRKITKKELVAIREALLLLGWDCGFSLACDQKVNIIDLTISAYPIRPDSEGVVR